jgi:hypothetical protein
MDFNVGHIEEMVYDSVVDGYCTECKEVTCNAKPDATENWCPSYEGQTVKSVPVMLGIC